MRNLLALAPALLAVVTTVHAQTLPEAVDLAARNFPDFRATLSDRRAAGELVGQARSALFPSIDTTLGGGRETSNNATTRFSGGDVTLTRREAEISLSQLLFDGGAATGQVRRFSARSDSSAYQVAASAETLALRVSQAYLDLLRLRGQVLLAQESGEAHERTLSQVDMLAEGGVGRRSDVQQAAGRLALSQSSLAQVRGQLELAEAEFRHFVGQPPANLRDPGSFEQSLPATLDAALAVALEASPAVRAAERELAAAQADRESARARLSPRLNLELGATQNNDVDGIRGPNNDRFAMLRLRYNLFRGGGDVARIREAEARVDTALAQLDKSRNDVRREVRLAWEALRADRMRLPQLATHAKTSIEVVDAYRAQFRIGQRTLLDVLNAENETFTARASVVNGLFAILSDELRILAGMGKLFATLGLKLPEEAAVEQP